MATIKPTTLAIINYLKENHDKKVTADDVARDLGLGKKSVIGSFNSIQRKNLGYRIEDEVENEDGRHVTVKYLMLNDEGMAWTPAQEDAE